MKGEVNYKQVGPHDAIAIIGRGSDVIKTVNKFNSAFAKELTSYNFGSGTDKLNPEISENNQNLDGKVISVDSKALVESSKLLKLLTETYGGFVLSHGAGHNAGLGDAGDLVRGGNGTRVPVISIMADGTTQYNYIRGISNGTDNLVNTPDNLDPKGVIQQKMLERYGTGTSTPTQPVFPKN